MTQQQIREEWVELNACKFCIGSHLHTCTSYQCKPAVEKAAEYFEEVVAQEEIRTMKEEKRQQDNEKADVRGKEGGKVAGSNEVPRE